MVPEIPPHARSWQLLSRPKESAETLIDRALDAQQRIRRVVAKRIRTLRVRAGLTHAAVGTIAGVSERLVGRWEDQLSEPQVHHLTKLAMHFGVTMDSMLGLAPGGAP